MGSTILREGKLFGRVRWGGHIGVQRFVTEVAMFLEGFKFPLTIMSVLGGILATLVFLAAFGLLKPGSAPFGYALLDAGDYRYYPVEYLEPFAAQLESAGWRIHPGQDLSRVSPPAGKRLETIGPAGKIHDQVNVAFDDAMAFAALAFLAPFAGAFHPVGSWLIRKRRLEFMEEPIDVQRFPSLRDRKQILDESEAQKAAYLVAVSLRGVWGLLRAQEAFKRFAEELQADRYVEGPRVMDLEEFRDSVESDPKLGRGRLTFVLRDGGVWMTMPDSLICKHVLFFGASGMGKTVLLLPMVHSAITQGVKSILSDVKCELIQYYPNAIRLNVMDKRGNPYNIFADLRTLTDCWEAGKALVPFEPGATRDGFFDPAVEMVLGGLLAGCWLRWQDTGDATWATWGKILDLLFGDQRGAEIYWKRAYDFLMQYTETQAAAAMIVDKGELVKQSGGVWTNIQQKLRFLEMFKVYAEVLPHESFSFVDYVKNPEDTRPVIIAYPPEYKQEMLPILRWFYTQGFTQCLGLPEREKTARGAYLVFFIDELPDILGAATDRLANAFLTLVTQVRSKGVSVVSATQDLGLLKQGLGEGRLESFVNNCGTVITANVGHPDLAEFISKVFGVQTIERAAPGASAGQVDMADRGNINWQRDDKHPVVKPSDIMTLEACQYYIKIGGIYVAHLDRVDFCNLPRLAPAYEPIDVRRVARLEAPTKSIEVDLDAVPEPAEPTD